MVNHQLNKLAFNQIINAYFVILEKNHGYLKNT